MGNIVSASRRTDIPAFYNKWFMNRIRSGYCLVKNPYYPEKSSRVSLKVEDVSCIVFWSKNPQPMMDDFHTLEKMGYKFYLQYTLNLYPSWLEPNVPQYSDRVRSFKEFSRVFGPERVIWRYDPIVISTSLTHDLHKRQFATMCNELVGATKKVTISLMVPYAKVKAAISNIQGAPAGEKIVEDARQLPETEDMLKTMAENAKEHGIEMVACAEAKDYGHLGIGKARCVDGDLIESLWGSKTSHAKDKGQRKECGCVQSKEIGSYRTCAHGCVYCYAVEDAASALAACNSHDPMQESLT